MITGITGQDGSYLSELLASEGVEVHGFVHPKDPNRQSLIDLVPSAVLHEGDLGSTSDVYGAIEASDPDEIYHLAAASSVPQSWEDPVTVTDLNGTGSVRILAAARKLTETRSRAPHVLLASSAEMFGHPAVSPQTEETPIDPVSPYGAVKAFAHRMAAILRGEGLHASTVILYNHESPRRPEHFVTRKITKAVAEIAAGSTQKLTLGNLAARRDWGFAGDYVRAMRDAVRHEQPDDYIIATGVSHSIEEFVIAAFKCAGVDDWQDHVAIDQGLFRPNDPAAFVGDATKARTHLGWRPEVDFDGLVELMVAHDMNLIGNPQ